jgi:soluble lytic murein transglycosylase
MRYALVTDKQRFLSFVLGVLAILLMAGCAEGAVETAEPAELDRLPPLEPLIDELLPTPTLAPGVPTRPLPTPPITPTVEPSGSQGAEDDAAEPTIQLGPPTATPEITQRLAVGADSLDIGDYSVAIEQLSKALQQEPNLEPELQADTLFKLGIAYLADGQVAEAATMFNQLFSLPGDEAPSAAYFHLAEASASLGDYETAVDAYRTYVDANPDMAAYIYPLIAETYLAIGDSESALEAYEASLSGSSHRIKEYETRQILASYYLADGDYEAAIAHYEAIQDFAVTGQTQGQMIYLAGAAELMAGNTDAAYERFLVGVSEYPEVYESYLGLVELVKAEVPVDEFQRGLVDFHAAAYAPGIEAFESYITANPEDYKPETHLYQAWSYEALEDLEAAYTQLDRYAEFEPAEAHLEQANMRARTGETETAVELYQQFLDDFPDNEEAPFAAWWAAALTEQMGDAESAIAKYVRLADDFPEYQDVPEALYYAGLLAHDNDDLDTAFSLWQRAAEDYSESTFGSMALVRLLRAEQEEESDLLPDLQDLAINNRSAGYPALRARDLAAGIEPFESVTPFALAENDLQDKATAEAWLLDQLELETEANDDNLGELSPELREDERLLVGEKLWDLRLYEDAKRELEALREDQAESLLSSYQLALFFRDLGLYRSSIIAGATVMDLAEQSVLETPPFIGRLAYPTYYAEQILALAEEYGYDPRLQFSLVRQESLYESFARSGAAAQGLSQVIPDTGAWIAERLQWPEYENEDLYKPYVGLAFGAYYLDQQLDAFEGNVHAALAAYNAGPGNAARWYELAGSDLDQFVDVVDFAETRTYVQRIYAGFDIYRFLYEG